MDADSGPVLDAGHPLHIGFQRPAQTRLCNYVDMMVADQPERPDLVDGLFRYGILNYGDRMHGILARLVQQ